MSNPYLAAIRAAHVARVEAAVARRLPAIAPHEDPVPASLIDAGCWLVQHGYEGDACAAEKASGWGPSRYRMFLATLSPKSRGEVIESGRRAIFDGRHPIYRDERLAA